MNSTSPAGPRSSAGAAGSSRHTYGRTVYNSLALISLVMAALAPRAGRFLRVADPLAPADAIVVLGGEAVGSRRAARGAELYFAGMAPRVVFSGGTVLGPDGRATSTMAEARSAGLAMGLPLAVAVDAPEAHSTYEEAVNLRAMAASHGWRTLIVVTDDYHSHRAARVFRAANPGLRIILSPVSVAGSDPGHWWENPAGVSYVCSELLKLAYYWARYGVAPL